MKISKSEKRIKKVKVKVNEMQNGMKTAKMNL